jgi:hypothetical protein
MITRISLFVLLNDLRQARDEALTEGDWDRVDFIGNCIDDTEKQLQTLDFLKETR